MKRMALGVFVLALAARLAHLFAFRRAPFFDFLTSDARAYDAWARRLAAGDWWGQEVFYQAPLYPYFLGVVHSLVGSDLVAVRAIQAVLGAASCALLAIAGARFFSPRAGLVSGILMALYAPSIFLEGLVQKTVLDLFFLSGVLALLGSLVDTPRRPTAFVTGLALGALALTRENALVIAAVILAWLALRPGLDRYRAVGLAALLAVGIACVLAPVALRNHRVGGEFHLTTSQLGPNLFIGNHAGANGTYRPLRPNRGGPRYERLDAVEMAEEATGRSLTPGEVSNYWTGQALAYVREQPFDWLALMMRKFYLLVNAEEIADAEGQYTSAEWSPVLRVTGALLHFGVLLPLALLGLWITRRDRSRLAVLYALTAAYAGSVLLFYVFARYRFPLVPPLALFAGAGLAELPRVASQVPRRELATLIAVIIAAALFSNWPSPLGAQSRATSEINLAMEFNVRGDMDSALTHAKRAVALRPESANAHYAIGLVHHKGGALDEAVSSYRRSLDISPYASEVRRRLDAALAAQRTWRSRQRELALALSREGHYQRAAEQYARTLDPVAGTSGSAALHLALGNEWERSDRPELAEIHYHLALAADPEAMMAVEVRARLDRLARETP